MPIPAARRYIAAMIALVALFVGTFIGWRRGAAIGGNTKDRAWYAGVFAILFALAGVVLTVILERAL